MVLWSFVYEMPRPWEVREDERRELVNRPDTRNGKMHVNRGVIIDCLYMYMHMYNMQIDNVYWTIISWDEQLIF